MELTLVPGASVARVAQAEGVNANQVFLWRRAHRNGELQVTCAPGTSLKRLTASLIASLLGLFSRMQLAKSLDVSSGSKARTTCQIGPGMRSSNSR